MALLDIPLDRATEADLHRLIVTGARESVWIDYKRATYGGTDADHAEFLADISSFANTLGGDLVIGVEARQGVPVSVAGLTTDADKELLRLEHMARAGLEPRLSGFTARAIPLASGGHVIVARVRRSFSGPHRVIFKNKNRFWARASSGKYEPNVEELRRLFNDLPHLAGRLSDFRMDRLVKVMAGDTPSPLGGSAKLVIHVVPVPAFADGRLTDVVAAVVNGTHVPLPPAGAGGSNRNSVNLDGFLTYADAGQGRRAYAQLFRSGAIEGVVDLALNRSNHPYFAGPDLANNVVGSIKQYLATLRSMEAGEPVYAFAAMCSASGSRMRYAGADGLGYETQSFEGDLIVLPEVLLDESLGDVPALVRPMLNALWNAYGSPQCDMYNAQGGWMGTA